MSEPRSDLTPRTDRPALNPASSPPLFIPNGAPTDDAPTVISKSLPRPANADEALSGLRGRRLAHFELLEAIGVGGMAAVLRARDTQLDRIVALKILPPEMANDPENISRFHQEARSAAKLDHENIARVFFCGEDQRLHFIAFEFVEGDNLRTILERRGRLPVGEALHYMLQIAAGLAHAAARGVVHRDIKPSNIIITPNGRAKLVDMGLARCLEPKDKGLTHSGVTLGTFDYISPEQALEPREADVRSDIYSLGCTFYHMVTGQPSVPEGTAAKKLHHHQHVKPADPRELAPGLPDQVAMIMARMMAKEPRDRYQTPEHLVHDLLLAARKIGGGGDVPEGVLAVEASLPSSTTYRPMLIVALAAAAVVVLILLLAPTSTPTPFGRRPAQPKNGDDRGKTNTNHADAGPKDAPKDPLKEPLPAVAKYDAEDVKVEDLTRWLKEHENADLIEVELARDLDLQVRDDSDPRLVFKAKKVVIRPKNPKRRPTIRLTYANSKLTPRAALTIDSKDATVEGVRVLLDGSDSKGAMTGLRLQGGGTYRVHRCDFTQAKAAFDEQNRFASIVFSNPPAGGSETPRALLSLTECCFLGFEKLETLLRVGPAQHDLWELTGAASGGQDAIVRSGPGRLEVSHCAFGPHANTFRFEGGNGEADPAQVLHCSVMAGHGSTAFSFHEDAAAQLDVRYSLFARPGEPVEGAGDKEGAYLLRQTGANVSANYRGMDNRYHNLDGYWASDVREETNYAKFLEKLAEMQGKDEGSRVLSASPWKEDQPLDRLEQTQYFVQFDASRKLKDDAAQKQSEEDRLAPVFQVKNTLRELRRTSEPDRSLIGVERLGNIQYANKLPTLEDKKPEPMARRTLIVDPSVAMTKDHTFKSLQGAIADAQPGDLILIRHTGDLSIKPIRLEEPALDLTIRPDAEHRPILTLGKTTESDASLFRLHDGKLRLEGLEFRLQPAKEFRAQAVTTLVGEGRCDFKDCVVTLDPAGDTAVAVATLADNGDVMKMEMKPRPLNQSPRLVFDNCFVRGKGDLIWSRVSRPFDFELKNSLVALQGNVLNVEVADGATPVMSTPNVGATVSHTTTYIAGYFVRLKSMKDLKGLVPVQCKATQSLFVAASGKTFIHLDGPETSEDRLKEKLLWTGEQNVYGGYTELFAQQPTGEEMRPPGMTADRWKTFTGDTKSKFERAVKFATPLTETPFTRLTPAMFKPLDLTDAGADVLQTPRPSAER